MRIKLLKVIALLVMISMTATTVGAQPMTAAVSESTAPAGASALPQNPKQVELEPAQATLVKSGGRFAADEPAVYIIVFDEPSLSAYEGGVAGLQATSPQVTGATKLDATSPQSVAYLDYLEAQHNAFVTGMERAFGRSVEVLFRYDAVLNGMAVQLSAEEAAAVTAMSGVKSVERDFERQITTDAGPEWIGAPGVWDGSATGVATMGEGTVIGVIDTGINGDHPSFAAVGPSDGYVHVNPLGAGVYLGACAGPAPTYTCNDKLIGAYDFAGDGPEDNNGHGSHTASTAAGNVLEDVVIDFPTITITPTISGVAPHANIIAYDACVPSGCPNSATNAAINQAVLDGVDVINYSIGGGPADPWQDSNSQAYLDARAAGVFVATSASNDGPGPGTIGSPANAPWLLSVGSASHNRTYTSTLSFGGGDSALADMIGTGLTGAYGPAPIVHAGDFGDALCGTAFGAGTWTAGEIVVCDRGAYALVDKVANAQAGGAGGVVIANAAANGLQTYASPYDLPTVHVNYDDAELLRAWLGTGSGHTATIAESVVAIDDAFGDRLSVFSSRGPNLPVLDVIKPNVIAPGQDILAAYRSDEEFNIISGTSMASPHAAGAALLLRALYPSWTEAQIQSALMSAAMYMDPVKEDWVTPADPFDMGGGRVYVSAAAQAGLVLDEVRASFEAADPLMGGEPSTLNLAQFGQDQCLESCTWTRELQSSVGYTVTWEASVMEALSMTLTVDPISFTLPAGGTQVITVEADVSALPVDEWFFGGVMLTPSGSDPGEETFTANPAAAIADNAYIGVDDGNDGFGADAGMACSVIDTSGSIPAGAPVTNVEIDLGMDHTWLGDLTAKVQSPAGTILALMERVQGDSSLNEPGDNVTTVTAGDSSDLAATSPLNFSDANAVDSEEMGLGIGGTAVACQDDGVCAYAPNPDQALVVGSSVANLAALNGDNASGNWTLCVGDGVGADVGTFQSWTITVTYGSGGPAAAHFPVAVQPTSGVLPGVVEVNTRRDAGSQLIPDLQAKEITELTIESFGLVPMMEHDFALDEIPDTTVDFPDIFFQAGNHVTELDVPAGSPRLVVEVLETTSPDLDMLVLYDANGNGIPELADVNGEECQSAAGGPYESCDIANPSAGTWFAIVINFEESASPPDPVTLGTAVVTGTDVGNMTFDGPTSVPKSTSFDLRVYWDEPALEAGGRWYGAFSIGTAPESAGDIGTIPVNLIRHDDDVTKTADVAEAWPGDTVTFTISVETNVTPEDLTYAITDTIPAGFTYVPGSASATAGTVNVVGNELTWNGMQAVPSSEYMMTTNATNPACINPLTGADGYADLNAIFGWGPDPGLVGDSLAWQYGGFPATEFYGEDKGTSPIFTDDGYATFVPSFSYMNQDIPDPAAPNDLVAPFWYDFEIVYDAATNKGVTAASGGPLFIVEFDDIEPYPAGGSGTSLDFEVIMWATPDDTPGEPEIYFAYDNIDGAFSDGTIGVENADGTQATNLAYDNVGSLISDDLLICLDYVKSGEAVEITYQATMDEDVPAGTILTNMVESAVDNPGSAVDETSVDVNVRGPEPTWEKEVWISGEMISGTVYSGLKMTDTVTIVDRVWIDSRDNITFTLTENWSESLVLEGYELPPGSAAMPGIEVTAVDGTLTWSVTDMSPDLTYIITKTFSVADGFWVLDTIRESLDVEGAAVQPEDVTVELWHAGFTYFIPVFFKNY